MVVLIRAALKKKPRSRYFLNKNIFVFMRHFSTLLCAKKKNVNFCIEISIAYFAVELFEKCLKITD